MEHRRSTCLQRAQLGFLLVLVLIMSHGNDVTTHALPTQADYLRSQPLATSNVTLDFLTRTLSSLDKTMTFFRREHRDVNLDTIIGTRIVEATMTIILQRLRVAGLANRVPGYVLDHVTKLQQESSQISNMTIPFTLSNDPEYFAKIGSILHPGVFQLNYDSRRVAQDGRVWPYNPEEVMQEEGSDNCLAELFGTWTGTVCDISPTCWTRMTSLGYNGYSLSHEVFYLEIAEGYGCKGKTEEYARAYGQPPISEMQDVLCANMLAEAQLIAKARFPMAYQDLFMEQAALCGLLGYEEFFQSDWLEAILSWQDKQDGCYKWDAWPQDRGDDEYPRLHSDPGRVKREEQRVSRGCLCHRTSVAASALAQYVRYSLQSWLEDQGYPPL